MKAVMKDDALIENNEVLIDVPENVPPFFEKFKSQLCQQ